VGSYHLKGQKYLCITKLEYEGTTENHENHIGTKRNTLTMKLGHKQTKKWDKKVYWDK
jgi:hypothetical protein